MLPFYSLNKDYLTISLFLIEREELYFLVSAILVELFVSFFKYLTIKYIATVKRIPNYANANAKYFYFYYSLGSVIPQFDSQF
jgi:hypothetical protein